MNLKSMLVLAAALLSTGVIQAATFVDVQAPNQYIEQGDTYNGVFNIVSPGSSTYTISGFPSGNGTFSDAGGYVLGTPLSDVHVRFYLTENTLFHFDIVDVSLGSFNPSDPIWLYGYQATINLNGQSAQINFLQQNGYLTYSMGSDYGDFSLSYAMLTADTITRNSVPDGGLTCVLLGFGLLGVGAVKRRLATTT